MCKFSSSNSFMGFEVGARVDKLPLHFLSLQWNFFEYIYYFFCLVGQKYPLRWNFFLTIWMLKDPLQGSQFWGVWDSFSL